jgi:hypothetical protein
MNKTRIYQHTFGRSAQTKILDFVWEHRKDGVNIQQLSKGTRNSYFYTLTVLKGLLNRNLVTKETKGNQSIIRPNEDHPIIKAMQKMPQ